MCDQISYQAKYLSVQVFNINLKMIYNRSVAICEIGGSETNSRRQANSHKCYMEIQNVELVTKSLEVLKKIFSFTEFDFEPEMLDYYKKAPERLDEFYSLDHN